MPTQAPAMTREAIENDHVPLPFLLGARAKDYLTQRRCPRQFVPRLRATASLSTFSENAAAGVGGGELSDVISDQLNAREKQERARQYLQHVLAATPPPRSPPPTSSSLSLPSSTMSRSRSEVLEQLIHDTLANAPPAERMAVPHTEPEEPTEEARAAFAIAMTHFHGYECRPDFLTVEGDVARVTTDVSKKQVRDDSLTRLRKTYKQRTQHTKQAHTFLKEQQKATKERLRHQHELLMAPRIDPARLQDAKRVVPTEMKQRFTRQQLEQEELELQKAREVQKQELEAAHERVQEQRRADAEARQQLLEAREKQRKAMLIATCVRPSYLSTLRLDDEGSASRDEPETDRALANKPSPVRLPSARASGVSNQHQNHKDQLQARAAIAAGHKGGGFAAAPVPSTIVHAVSNVPPGVPQAPPPELRPVLLVQPVGHDVESKAQDTAQERTPQTLIAQRRFSLVSAAQRGSH